MIQAAIAAGLDAIVLTDHDRLAPPARLAALNAKYAPFRIFGGIEVSLIEGEHVLVLGLQHPSLESGDWDYPALYDFVHEREGFLVLNHPFRYLPRVRIDLRRYPPDAIELYSHNTPLEFAARIRALAAELRILLVANSDAHQVDRVGAYYNTLASRVRDNYELVAELRFGNHVCYGPGRAPQAARVETMQETRI